MHMMKTSLGNPWMNVLALAGILLAATSSPAAEPPPLPVEVRAWLGKVSYARAGGSFQPVTRGTSLAPGDSLRTEVGSAVDVYLGELAGTVRVTERSTLVIEQAVAKDPAAGGGFEIKLALKSGELLGRVAPHGGGSRFQVAVPVGIAAVVEGGFRVDARGYMVLLDGKGLFVHAPDDNTEPVAHSLTTPPAVYFSPRRGVNPAPAELVREVAGQTRSKLPKH